MTRVQVYLMVFALVGWCSAYPHKKPYVVTYIGDGEGQELLGSRMCTRGPSYWCHNITQAAECHAMKHCIKKVWENPVEKLPEDNDSVCKVCLDMVQQARDQLLSNETQDELRQVLEGSCNLIPIKLVAKECDELADDFIPELIDALTSRMDPQMVCHISGLCNNVRIDEMLEEMKEIDHPKEIKPLNPDNFDTCPKCEYFIGKYEDTFKKMAKTDLRDRLLNICGYLGSYSESCRGAVIRELDAIYDYIQKDMKPKEICSLIGLCHASPLHRVALRGQQAPTTTVRVWEPPKTNKDDMECDFCKQLTESVRKWLVANNTEEEFQKVLEGLCKQTGKHEKECLNLVQQYSKEIYDTLVNDLKPDEFCRTLGLCPGGHPHVQLTRDNGPIWTILAINKDSKKDTDSSSEEDDDSMPLMRLLPAEHLAGDDERNSLRKKEKVECEFCEYALHYLQEYLSDAKTEEEFRVKVENFCAKRLPSAFAQQCKMMVDEYGDALVTLFAQEVDPSEICPRLRVCPEPTPTPRVVTAVGQPVKDILPTCALCTFTVEKLIDLVGKNVTKESIDAAMEGVCTHLPHRMEGECMSFMKNYGDQVAEMILIYGTSHGVCAAIHLCLLQPVPPTPSKIIIESQLPLDRYLPRTVTLDRVAEMKTVEDDSKKCVMCEFVITTLDQRLQDNATEEEIKTEVEHICTYLPKTVQGRCETFVDVYGEQIIQYLTQEVDPAEICQQLDLCKSEKKVHDTIKNLTMDRCQLCMLISDYLSTLVEEEEKDVNIDELATKTCALIPKSYRQECNALIEDYGAYLLNILAQETDKGKACAQIQLCPALDQPAIVEDNSVDTFEY